MNDLLNLPSYLDHPPEVAARVVELRGRPTVMSINGLSREFRSAGAAPTVALSDVSFEVRQREFISVIGPSGCGKSTLIRILAGLDYPTGGEARLDGRAIRGPGADRGMVFQSYTLFPWLSVVGNVMFGLKMKGVTRRQAKHVALDWLERVGLRDFADAYPSQLSGGMKQRVAIARALANEPRILLMDEPFGALDNQTRSLMQELLLSIWESDRKTVLFVTHDIDEAIFMANRVAVFSARPGRIKSEIAVDLPHPRHYTVKTTSEFMELKARLTEEIRAESMAAAEH